MVNYYRRFIKDFFKIANPLSELTKNKPFIWGKEEDNAFQRLKKAVVTAPVLRQFDTTRKIHVTTDASRIGFGAVMNKNSRTGANLYVLHPRH